CARAGQGVEERLLFDGIAVNGTYITVGGVELAVAVVAHFADPRESGGNRAAMAAGKTFDAFPVERPVQLGLAGGFSELAGESLHANPTKVSEIIVPPPKTV